MFDLFQYSFVVRGLEAGILVALIAPLIGIFMVLRRYSLIADTLSHVSFAGVAVGFLFNINPLITALIASVMASFGIERLRRDRRVYGDSALALFLSGSLALAVILISLGKGFNVNLLNYLFGSILTVQNSDLWTIGILGLIVAATIGVFFKELVYITFDEDAAQVSGVPVRFINTLLIVLAAVTISLAIPVVGVLLISALIVIPVLTALQFKRGFLQTIFIAEFFSVLSVVVGIIVSFELDLAAGATIVLVNMVFFIFSLMLSTRR